MKEKFGSFKHWLVLMLLPFFLSSCFTPVVFHIQTLKPARIVLPDSLYTSGILIASLVESDSVYKADRAVMFNKNQFLENIAATELAFALSNNLLNSPLFQDLKTIPIFELPPIEYLDTLPLQFSENEIFKLSSDFQTDMIFTLEFFNLEYVEHTRPFVPIPTKSELKEFSFYDNSIVKFVQPKKASVLLRIYNTQTGIKISEYLFQDNFIWMTSPGFSLRAKEITEEELFFYEESGIYLGEKISQIISPTWLEEERTYYFGIHSNFNKAYYLAMVNNWTIVQQLMEQLTSHRNNRVAAHAFFNLALSFEMQGDLKNAFIAAENAAKLKNKSDFTKYKKILENRLNEKELLDLQLAK